MLGFHCPCILMVSALIGYLCFLALNSPRPMLFLKNITCSSMVSGPLFFTPICLLLPLTTNRL